MQGPIGKIVASHDPFPGADEQVERAGRIGAPENVRALLQIYARRLAMSLNDSRLRTRIIGSLDRSDRDGLNLGDILISQPSTLATLADGFAAEATNKIDGDLRDVIASKADADALLAAAQGIFGLKISLVDPLGAYNGTTPLHVYHNPITDESITKWIEGFDSHGDPVTIPFSSGGYQGSTPFLYVSQDEDSSDERLGDFSAVPKPTHQSLLSYGRKILGLFVTDVFANGSIDACYHDESTYLTLFKFTDDHEGVGSPEMKIRISIKYEYGNVPDNGNYNYTSADNVNTKYPLSGDPHIEIFKHSGLPCVGDLFNPGIWYEKEDELTIRVREYDTWPNPDDDVGYWTGVPIHPTGNVTLYPTHSSASGTPQDAYVSLHTNFPGLLLP